MLNYNLYVVNEDFEITKHLGEYRKLAQVEESIRRNRHDKLGRLRLINPRGTVARDLIAIQEDAEGNVGQLIWAASDPAP